MGQPQLLFHLFLVFSSIQYNFTTNKCGIDPSDICCFLDINTILQQNVKNNPFGCWDLNSRPLVHESPSITTKPELPPKQSIDDAPTTKAWIRIKFLCKCFAAINCHFKSWHTFLMKWSLKDSNFESWRTLWEQIANWVSIWSRSHSFKCFQLHISYSMFHKSI